MVSWDTWAALEKDTQASQKNAALDAELTRLSAQDGELLSGIRTMLASCREDLSYRADVSIAPMRDFSVTTIRVNPGHEPELAAARKLINEAHAKAKMDEHWATYQVVSGAPADTFLLFLPMKSLTELDTAREIHGKLFQDALGEDNRGPARSDAGRDQELGDRALHLRPEDQLRLEGVCRGRCGLPGAKAGSAK